MANVKDSKHLTLDDRERIEEMLGRTRNDTELKDIAKAVGKDPRTVSKEVKLRRVKFVSARKDDSKYAGWDKSPCKWLARWPFVCNGCPGASRCVRDKFYYRASKAQASYRQTLVDSRSGIDASPEEIKKIDGIVKRGLEKKQSVYAIVKNHCEDIRKTDRTIYNYVNRGALSVGPIDLHSAVKLKPRDKKYAYARTREQSRLIASRGFADYQEYMGTHDISNVAQMDTVEGARGSRKALLTIHLPSQHLMLVRLLAEKTAANVTAQFDRLERILGLDEFRRLFGVILTDRGSEFMDVEGLEASCTVPGERRMRLFFCSAYESSQKGAIESNHRLIRYVIPKKTMIDFLTDEMVQRVQDNMNSYARKSMGGWTPYEMFERRFGRDDIDRLGLKKVDREEVDLSPSLLMGK